MLNPEFFLLRSPPHRLLLNQSRNAENAHRRLQGSMRKVALIRPFMRHRCCLGCITLPHALRLIAIAEILQIVLFTLVMSQIALNDGIVFYTHELEGHGLEILSITGILAGVSLITIVILLVGQKLKRPMLYIPHIAWQLFVIITLCTSMLIVFTRIQSPTSTIQREFQIAYPTVTVILILTSIPTLLEIWWLVVVLDAFRSERADKRYNFYESVHTNGRPSNADTDSAYDESRMSLASRGLL